MPSAKMMMASEPLLATRKASPCQGTTTASASKEWDVVSTAVPDQDDSDHSTCRPRPRTPASAEKSTSSDTCSSASTFSFPLPLNGKFLSKSTPEGPPPPTAAPAPDDGAGQGGQWQRQDRNTSEGAQRPPTAAETPASAAADPSIDAAHLRRREREEQQLQEEVKACVAKWADEVARIEAEASRAPAETLQSETLQDEKNATPCAPAQLMPSPPPSPHPNKPPPLGIFNILSRGRGTNDAAMSPVSSLRTSTDRSKSDGVDAALPAPKSFAAQGTNTFSPGSDAPLSASNGGDRELSVRCSGATISVTIKNDTNCLEVLLECAAKVPHMTNTSSSNVVEMYNQLGLRRRVRCYERIRDIIDSWDFASNCLVVEPGPVGNDKDLDSADAPRTGHAPNGFTLQLYHSQHPRKWNKRYVTLLESGQIFSSKKSDPAAADKDSSPLCHLSDFDVYTPTEAQAKQLRSPKKYCYAVKSQQKATVFVHSQNFVHFFSTDDPVIARTFHSLVRAWRSWYLMGKLIQTEKEQTGPAQPGQPPARRTDGPLQLGAACHEPKKTTSHIRVKGHKIRISVDETPYTIGAFEPLLDLGRFDKPLDEFGKDWIPDRMSTLLEEREEPRPEVKSNKAGTSKAETKGPFAAGALLGDSYDKRKHAARENHGAGRPKAAADGPFTPGPSLLNGGAVTSTTAPDVLDSRAKAEPSGWFPSAIEHSARQRSDSANRPSPPRRPGTASGAAPAPAPPPSRPRNPATSTTPSLRQQHHQQHHRRPARPPQPAATPLVDLIAQREATSSSSRPSGPSAAAAARRPPPLPLQRRPPPPPDLAATPTPKTGRFPPPSPMPPMPPPPPPAGGGGGAGGLPAVRSGLRRPPPPSSSSRAGVGPRDPSAAALPAHMARPLPAEARPPSRGASARPRDARVPPVGGDAGEHLKGGGYGDSMRGRGQSA